MKFYDREEELKELTRIRELSFEDHSRLTVVTGRRRIGKTSLIMRAVEGTATLYFFVARKNEADLCSEFCQAASETLGIMVPKMESFKMLFMFLMEQAENRSFNLVIDEFQEFYNINSSVFSDMQNIWDQNRLKTKMNLIVCGSIYSLMHKIFQNSKEPLFGRSDNIIRLSEFSTKTLKQILKDHAGNYENEDLLALYTITGGVPKYVELFMDSHILTKDEMIAFLARNNSPFVDEGKNLLIEEFGKNYAVYFSILSSISRGLNTQPELEAQLGSISLGGHLKRLIEDYGIITRIRPILSKPNSQKVRFEIKDNFLRFWFNYFDRNRSLVEIKNFPALQKIIASDYQTYSGKMLEKYFRQKMAESYKYREIGSWWEPKNDQNEIDIVALELENNKAVAVEVKRQKKNFRPDLFSLKVQHLKEKAMASYDIEPVCLSLSDM